MKNLLILAVIAALTFFSGCASIIDPGPDKVSVKSDPEGATVIYNGEKVGETPLEVELDRSKSAVLAFEKEGYYPLSIMPVKVINGWALAGGILILIDLALDNENKYSEKPIKVTMTQK